MVWHKSVNKDQILRWCNPEGVFAKILENQFMLDKSILSSNWLNEQARQEARNIILDILHTEVEKEHGFSVIHYSPSLNHMRLAKDETNEYEIIEKDNEYYLYANSVTGEMFKLKELFGVIIDEPEASPVILFKATTTVSGAGGLIGLVINNFDSEVNSNAISAMMHTVRLCRSVYDKLYVEEVDGNVQSLLNAIEKENEEHISDSTAALLIAVGLNNPVRDPYYEKQLGKVILDCLTERRLIGNE